MKLIASLPTTFVQKDGTVNSQEWKRVTAAWEEMKRVLNAKPNSGGPELQTDGVDNSLQALLNLIAGSNITLTPDGSGGVTIAATGSGTAIALKTNGVLNTLQTVLNLIAGTHVTLTADGAGGVTFDVAWPVLPITFGVTAHQFLKSYDATTGLFTAGQPTYSDISGVPQLAQTIAKVAHKWLDSYDAVTGVFTQSQPDYDDLTGTPTIPTPLYSRGFAISNTALSTAPHIRAGIAGTINKVTAVSRLSMAGNFTAGIYAGANHVCDITITGGTAADTIVAVTSFLYTTVTADTLFSCVITASDGTVDPAGVVTLQVYWS